MIYLGNGMYSDSSLSHGGPWKNHKYIRIENGRYIYPGDIGGNKGKINWGAGSGSNPNNSKANNAFRRDTIKAARKTADVDYEMAAAAQQQKFWESQKPESISSQVDFVATQKALDDALDNQDKNGTQVSTKTYSRNAPPPEIKYKEGRDRHKKQNEKPGVAVESNPYLNKLKRENAINTMGPSAAERAQTVRRRQAGKGPESVSRNTSKNDIRALRGQDTTKYLNKLKRENAINTMGPSAAERAQNRPLSKVSGRSRNVSTGSSIDRRYKQYKTSVQSQGPSAAEMAQRNANGGSRNVEKKPKKKKSVKSAVKSWVKKNIIGAPGKVTTHN